MMCRLEVRPLATLGPRFRSVTRLAMLVIVPTPLAGCYTDNSELCNPELTVGTEVEVAIVERYDMNTTTIDPPANDVFAERTCGEQLALRPRDIARVAVLSVNERGPEPCRRTEGTIVSLSLNGEAVTLENIGTDANRGSFLGAIHAVASVRTAGNCSGTLYLTLRAPAQLPVLDRSFVPEMDASADCGVELQPGHDGCIDSYVFEYTEYPEK
jgi:hypothetical protein